MLFAKVIKNLAISKPSIGDNVDEILDGEFKGKVIFWVNVKLIKNSLKNHLFGGFYSLYCFYFLYLFQEINLEPIC